MKTVLRGVFLLLLIVVLGMVAGAQDDWPYEPVYEGLQIGDMEWMPDSSGLIFLQYHDRLLYSPQTNTIVPYDASLPEDLFQFLWDNTPFSLYYGDYNGPDSSTIFISPNGRFIAYIVDFVADYDDPEMGAFPGVVVMDLTNGAAKAVEDIMFPDWVDYTPSPFQLHWSLDSTAFTIEPDGSFLDTAYIVQISHDIETIKTTFLYRIDSRKESESYLVNPRDYLLRKIYDIDPTGRFVLASGYSWLEKQGGVIVFDIETLAVELLPEGIQSISFKQSDTPQLFYTTDAGLFEYDLLTRISHLINPNYNFDMNISPDGHYGAFVKENNLYVLPLDP